MWGFHRLLLGCFCIYLLLTDAAGWRTFFRGRARGGLVGIPKVSRDYILPKEEWFQQRLDHSKPTTDLSWKQRYFTNNSFYKPGGPVFLLIGGEQAVSPLWMVEGQWIEYAKRFNALCFQLEHRFYGSSHPKDSASTNNLEYLTSQQALGDLAHFITTMNIKYELPPKTKWIAFGGSYPGALAAWLRARYPHIVHAAISTSAPLLAKADFREYFRVVQDDLEISSDSCVQAVREATVQIEILMKSPMGRNVLKSLFHLCSNLNIEDSEDISSFYEILAGNIAAVAQYNNDNRQFEGVGGAGVTLKIVCNVMKNQSIGPPIYRYAEVNKLMLDTYSQECLEHEYYYMIQKLKEKEWDSDAVKEGDRQWLYQTCTEFGFFQTSSLCTEIFSDEFPLEFYLQHCKDTFGRRFNVKLVQKGIERTNREYGDLHIKASRIVFVHGSFDPWHALGIIKTVDPLIPSIYISGTAHCADMYPSTPKDPPQLKAARTKIGKLIAKWLQEH